MFLKKFKVFETHFDFGKVFKHRFKLSLNKDEPKNNSNYHSN